MVKRAADEGASLLTPFRAALLLFAAAFLVYAHTLSYDLVWFDDYQLLYVNKELLSSASNIGRLFSMDAFLLGMSPYYRPLLSLSLMTDTLLNGPYFFVYHLTNIMLHGASASLLYLVLLRLDRGRVVSLFLSLLFLCHPALTQAVAWVPGRNDSMLCVFVLLVFLSFLRFLDGRSRVSLLSFTLFFLCALFTKETAVMLPPLLFFYCLYNAAERPGKSTWLPLAVCSAAVITVWGLARFSSQLVDRGVDIPLTLLNAKALIVMLGKTVFPVNLGVWGALSEADYRYGALVIGLMAAALIFLRTGRKSMVAFGLLWYFLFLAPTLVAIPHTAALIVWEHRLYLPLVGFVLAVSEFDLVRKMDLSRFVVGVPAAALLLLSAFLAFAHSYNFSNRMAFWESASQESPADPGITIVLASIYHLDQLLPLAERYYRKSLELDPATPYAHGNLAGIYALRKQGKLEERELKLELLVNPSNSVAARGLEELRSGKARRGTAGVLLPGQYGGPAGQVLKPFAGLGE